ncbi:MAG: hypothetical protein R3Y43_05770 [Alphaproteobacteria bacterium]
MNKTKLITGGTIGLTFLLNANITLATDTCAVTSSCEALGYTKSASNCTEYVKCPFNTSLVACTKEKLATGYYLLKDGRVTNDTSIATSSTVRGIVVSNYSGGGYSVYVGGTTSTYDWYEARAYCIENYGGASIPSHYTLWPHITTINNALSAVSSSIPQINLSTTRYWTSTTSFASSTNDGATIFKSTASMSTSNSSKASEKYAVLCVLPLTW